MYKLGDRFSGSRNGILALFKNSFWPCFQFVPGLPLFKDSLKCGFDITKSVLVLLKPVHFILGCIWCGKEGIM